MPVTHVLFKTGEIQDVEAIVRRAHEVGAHVVLDAYQSAGTVPLDVTALDVDFAVGGSVKWLLRWARCRLALRSPGSGRAARPSLTGWQAHARPFEFEPEMEYAPGAARFLTGTPNVPALYAATAGYDLIEEIGVERIREHSMRQTALLVELLDEAGFDLTGPLEPERRGGTVTVRDAGIRGRAQRARRRARSCATSGPTPGYGSGPTTSRPTTSSASRSSRSWRSSRRARPGRRAPRPTSGLM